MTDMCGITTSPGSTSCRLMLIKIAVALVTTLILGCSAIPDRIETTSLEPDLSAQSKIMVKTGSSAKVSTNPMLPKITRGSSYLGSAPYICKPSGFGMTSSCFLRNG